MNWLAGMLLIWFWLPTSLVGVGYVILSVYHSASHCSI